MQVWHDLLGLFTDFVPKHAKRYANLGEIDRATRCARTPADVRAGAFPTEKESFVKQPAPQEVGADRLGRELDYKTCLASGQDRPGRPD